MMIFFVLYEQNLHFISLIFKSCSLIFDKIKIVKVIKTKR